jgi:hypothetical protein
VEGSRGAFLDILHGDFLNSTQETERPAMYAVPFFHGRTIAEAVYRRLLVEKDHIRSQANPCGIWGGKSVSGTGFFGFTLPVVFRRYSTIISSSITDAL